MNPTRKTAEFQEALAVAQEIFTIQCQKFFTLEEVAEKIIAYRNSALREAVEKARKSEHRISSEIAKEIEKMME
jgi:ATP-dependent Clp protease ATP-binding subunit ClpA